MPQVQSAVKALIVKDGKFLVIRQVFEDLDFWDLPGGRVEFGSNPLDCLKREVQEEVSMDVDIIKPIGLWYFFRTRSEGDQVVCATFLCHPKTEKVDLDSNPDQEENITEFKWLTIDEFLTDEYYTGHESLKKLLKEHFTKN